MAGALVLERALGLLGRPEVRLGTRENTSARVEVGGEREND